MPHHHHHLIYATELPPLTDLHPHFQWHLQNWAPAAYFLHFGSQPLLLPCVCQCSTSLQPLPHFCHPTISLHWYLPPFQMACLKIEPEWLNFINLALSPSTALCLWTQCPQPPLPPHPHHDPTCPTAIHPHFWQCTQNQVWRLDLGFLALSPFVFANTTPHRHHHVFHSWPTSFVPHSNFRWHTHNWAPPTRFLVFATPTCN